MAFLPISFTFSFNTLKAKIFKDGKVFFYFFFPRKVRSVWFTNSNAMAEIEIRATKQQSMVCRVIIDNYIASKRGLCV
jgi:hypothetical protein